MARKQAWSGWGRPMQRVAGWDFDHRLNGYITTAADRFSCDCGEEFPTPSGYRKCGSCGRAWNSYVIGTDNHGKEASLEKVIVREIPVRKDVIVASKRRRTAEDDFGYAFDTPPKKRDRAELFADDEDGTLGKVSRRRQVGQWYGPTDWGGNQMNKHENYAYSDDDGRFTGPTESVVSYPPELKPGGHGTRPRMKRTRVKNPEDYPPPRGEGRHRAEARRRRAKDDGECTCWEGYERVPGTKPCAKGSCRKKAALRYVAWCRQVGRRPSPAGLRRFRTAERLVRIATTPMPEGQHDLDVGNIDQQVNPYSGEGGSPSQIEPVLDGFGTIGWRGGSRRRSDRHNLRRKDLAELEAEQQPEEDVSIEHFSSRRRRSGKKRDCVDCGYPADFHNAPGWNLPCKGFVPEDWDPDKDINHNDPRVKGARRRRRADTGRHRDPHMTDWGVENMYVSYPPELRQSETEPRAWMKRMYGDPPKHRKPDHEARRRRAELFDITDEGETRKGKGKSNTPTMRQNPKDWTDRRQNGQYTKRWN